jgi:hypothetical protein
MMETLSVELVIIVEKKLTPTPRCCCCTEKAVAAQGVLSLKLASKQQKKP